MEGKGERERGGERVREKGATEVNCLGEAC